MIVYEVGGGLSIWGLFSTFMLEMLALLLILVAVIFMWMQSTKVRFVSTPPRDDAGYEVLRCLGENEVNHALRLIELRKYEELQNMIQNNPNVLQEIYRTIGPDYVFQDYMLSIEKSAISTCHRDENGQLFNDRVVHPAYTILFFLEPMEACLDVISGSHRRTDFINLSQPLESVRCTPGQAILFNADLIHSGAINEGREDNRRVQMKLIHKDDVGKIPQFDDYHKVADASKSNARWYTKFVRDMSCKFTGVADITKNGENLPEFIKTLYRQLAYGGGDKYKLYNFR